jgi:hypothetical protein
MVEIVDKSSLSDDVEGAPKGQDSGRTGAADVSRIDTADKSTKDSKKVRLGETGGITF